MKRSVNGSQILLIDVLIVYTTWLIACSLPNSVLVIPFGALVLILNTLRLKWDKQIHSIFNWMIRYRYPIALVIFVLCVLVRLHGSSINVVQNYLIASKGSSNLFGVSHAIRSDEYDVQLPYYFSQYYNAYRETSYQMSLSGQDMILGYNSPVWSLTLIGKPFVWGYILFGNEIGLSWYWCMKLILGILVMYEMMVILTKQSEFSMFGAFFIIFSPAMQWWFSPHIYDAFFWGAAIFVVGYHFFAASGTWQKFGFTILAVGALTGYVLALFPSLQIPLGILALVMMIVCLYRDRSEWKWQKKDWLWLLAGGAGLTVVLGSFVLTAQDAIRTLSETVYPGHRVSTGGNCHWSDLFTNLSNMFFPYTEKTKISNPCELCTFNHLGPVCLAYFPYLAYKIRKKKIRNVLPAGIVLAAALMIEIIFMIIGFPVWLAKVTLFSYVNRMPLVYGYTATLFTLWTMSVLIKYPLKTKLWINLVYTFGFGVIYLHAASLYDDQLAVSHQAYLAWAVVFVLAFLLMTTRRRRLVTALMIMITAISGMTVNPIAHGTDGVTEYKIVEAAEKLNKKKDGYWLTVNDEGGILQNILLANGSKVLNAVNFYPDYGKWKAVDPKGKYDDAYNRYAHQSVVLTDKKTSVKTLTPDSILVSLNYQDLKKWHVTYLASKSEISEKLTEYGYQYKETYHDRLGYRIYQLEYDS